MSASTTTGDKLPPVGIGRRLFIVPSDKKVTKGRFRKLTSSSPIGDLFSKCLFKKKTSTKKLRESMVIIKHEAQHLPTETISEQKKRQAVENMHRVNQLSQMVFQEPFDGLRWSAP